MKIRSFLIVACMVVVPLIAMFSHRIPSGTRAAVAAYVRDLAGWRPAQPRASEARAAAPGVESSPPEKPGPGEGAAAEGPALPAATATSAGEAPPVVPVVSGVAETEAIGRLRELGALTVDCRPLADHGGHVASCRLPVDGSGQLERVFQSTGVDAAMAVENLLREVLAWRHGTPPAGAGSDGVARPGAMRF